MRAARALALAAALALAGCNPGIHQQPDQAAAMKIVWVEQYGVTSHDPPVIEWVEGADLNCDGHIGWTTNAGPVPGQCVAGLFFYGEWLADVAWPDGTQTFSTTAFAHELCHALEGLQSGGTVNDYDHTGPCFTPDGGYTQLANNALAAAGL